MHKVWVLFTLSFIFNLVCIYSCLMVPVVGISAATVTGATLVAEIEGRIQQKDYDTSTTEVVPNSCTTQVRR